MSRDTSLVSALARYAVFFSLSLGAHLVVCLGGERASPPEELQRLVRAAREAAERPPETPGEVRRP